MDTQGFSSGRTGADSVVGDDDDDDDDAAII
jgi:hypothetical protein